MLNDYKERITDFLGSHQKGIKLFVFITLASVMVLRGVMQIPQIEKGKQEIERLKSRIEYEQQRQNEIATLRDKVDTDEYIEKIASERLGLIKSNAKIFVDVSGEQQ